MSQNENFEYGYPHSNAFLQFHLNLSVASRINPHVIQRNVMYVMTSNFFPQYITGYTVAIFDVILYDAALQNQVH